MTFDSINAFETKTSSECDYLQLSVDSACVRDLVHSVWGRDFHSIGGWFGPTMLLLP